jgi:hypothetical protein
MTAHSRERSLAVVTTADPKGSKDFKFMASIGRISSDVQMSFGRLLYANAVVAVRRPSENNGL